MTRRVDPSIEQMETALHRDDQAAFLQALRHAIQLRGGMTAAAQAAGVSRTTLYKTIAGRGNPTLRTTFKLLTFVGARLCVTARSRRRRVP